MKSKKILSVLLSAMLLFVSMLSVSAADNTAEIDVNVDVFEITVMVKTDAVGQMNLQIVNKDNNVLAAMTESAEYVTLEEGSNEYTFTIRMQPTHATGTYVVRVGNNVAVTEEEFTFVNAYDVVDFYNALNDATAEDDEIYNLLTGEDSKTTYDVTVYKALTEEVRLLVDAEIEKLNLATTMDNVEEKEAEFKNLMDVVMPAAVMSDSKTDSETWNAYVDASLKAGKLDDAYANVVSAEKVEEFYRNSIIATIDMDEIAKIYDGAALLAVIDELDYITVREAIAYYLEKDVLDIDVADYDAVVDANLANDLAKEVRNRKAEATDIAAVENLIDDITLDLLNNLDDEEEEEVKRPTSGGGGGGGSSRPSGTASKNPNPSTGAVIDANAGSEAKKEDVVYNTKFADLGEAAWAAEAIEGLAAKGYVSGRGDGNFYPNDVMTREEFVKLIVVSFNAYDETATASFEDVAADRWSYPYIASANRLGLVTGISETEFNPAGSITREDMAVIMHRLYKLLGLPTNAKTLEFTDTDAISDYAKEAVSVLAGDNIIKGMGDGTFAPKASVTRAQASKVVYELLALIGGVN